MTHTNWQLLVLLFRLNYLDFSLSEVSHAVIDAVGQGQCLVHSEVVVLSRKPQTVVALAL